jgi:hypothetical protein
MTCPLTVEVTFAPPGEGPAADLPPCEGTVRLPDGRILGFSGWLDLLATLERAARAGGGT